MTIRIFAAALGAEVNTFSPIAIDRARFEELWLYPAGSLDPRSDPPLIAAMLRRAWALAADGILTVTQGLCAGAQPGGMIARQTYEALRDELLADLAAAGRVDIAIIGLHGATVAQGEDDCDGDILARVRAVVGNDVVVAGLLDPHCHLTAAMLDATDLLYACKEYPHDDIFAVADRLVDDAVRVARGEAAPVVRAWDCRSIGTFPTYPQPMRGLIDRLLAEQRDDPRLLDISIAQGFPWGDVAEAGLRVWVTADGDADAAAAVAERYGRDLEGIRTACQPTLLSIDEAVAAARADDPRPLILAETADNPGGGAPGDATHLLAALLDAGLDQIACALIWDSVAVDLCVAAGEGAKLPLRIGGKVCRLSGRPLDLEVRVVRILDALEQPFGGGSWPSGMAVRVETDQATLILSATRTQCLASEAFTALGVDLTGMRAVVVKSSNHFEGSFRRVSGRIERVATPGVLTPDVRMLPYANLQRPIWPLDGEVAGRALPPAGGQSINAH